MVMTEAGHSLTQNPQPTHRSGLIRAKTPFGILIASLLQTFTQHPQATQWDVSIVANFFGFGNDFDINKLQSCMMVPSITRLEFAFCNVITKRRELFLNELQQSATTFDDILICLFEIAGIPRVCNLSVTSCKIKQ